MRLKVGTHQALIVQEYQTLCDVISQALGGSASKTDPRDDPAVLKPRNVKELTDAMNMVFKT